MKKRYLDDDYENDDDYITKDSRKKRDRERREARKRTQQEISYNNEGAELTYEDNMHIRQSASR